MIFEMTRLNIKYKAKMTIQLNHMPIQPTSRKVNVKFQETIASFYDQIQQLKTNLYFRLKPDSLNASKYQYIIQNILLMGAIVNHCCDYEYYDLGSTRCLTSCSQRPIKSLPSIENLRRQTSLQEILKIQMVEQPPDKIHTIKEEDNQDQYIDEVVEQSTASKKQSRISFQSFNVCGVFGQGSLGSVLQVELKQEASRGIHQGYAMKRIPRQRLVNHKNLANLKLQRQILTGMSHPFITQLRYGFTDRHFVYLVMEEATEGDASSLVDSGKRRAHFSQIGQEGVRFIGASIVLALEYLHSQHFLYGDLKASNILLFANGYAKLSDYGLAKTISRQNTSRSTQTDSLLHSAPEIAMHLGYSKCVDFWALGAILYELATGFPPFKLEDMSQKAQLKKIIKAEETTHNWRGIKVSAQLQHLVGALLRYKPDQRLGVRGWFEIKEHRFFKDFDWQALWSKTMQSPLLPLLHMQPFEGKHFKQLQMSRGKEFLISHFQPASQEALLEQDQRQQI